MMAGWVYLPRFIDKVRLHLAGQLPPDYQENFTKGFDERWLNAAGLTADQFIDVVKNSITDGQVCDWIRKNVNKSEAEKNTFNTFILNRGRDIDPAAHARLEQRKKELGFPQRADIQTFVDMIEADEGRL
jgi:hypothetical protein